MKISGQDLIAQMLQRKAHKDGGGNEVWRSRETPAGPVVKGLPDFEQHPTLKMRRLLAGAAKTFGIENPFFRIHEGAGGHRTRIDGREYINFSHYNYLGLNGHPEVNAAAKEAIDQYGTSVGASRLVAGERPVQGKLENALAALYNSPACVVFVSGHATNVSTISTLFGPQDLIVHDSLSHNSILEGIRLSGATRRSFPHNDLGELEELLVRLRPKYQRALVVVEGLYSMDGDIPDLPAIVALKRRHGAFLMVDEAHALGVLGKSGRGSAEHFGLNPADVDIWMGTLSKTLAGCGGYIVGSQALVDILKCSAPGFVYSVGLAPVLAGASLKALEIMQREPERVARLHERGQLFQRLAREAGLNVGASCGFSIVPVIVGSSKKAVVLSNQLFACGINVQPIIHPAVEEKAARLRFFLSSEHTEEEIARTCRILAGLIQGRDMAHDLE